MLQYQVALPPGQVELQQCFDELQEEQQEELLQLEVRLTWIIWIRTLSISLKGAPKYHDNKNNNDRTSSTTNSNDNNEHSNQICSILLYVYIYSIHSIYIYIYINICVRSHGDSVSHSPFAP